MITGSLTQTFENAKGLVSLVVTDSDLSGAKVAVLTRYADNRPDSSRNSESFTNFQQAIFTGQDWFKEEVDNL